MTDVVSVQGSFVFAARLSLPNDFTLLKAIFSTLFNGAASDLSRMDCRTVSKESNP